MCAASVRWPPVRPQLGGPHPQTGPDPVPGDRRGDRCPVACRAAETLEPGQGQPSARTLTPVRCGGLQISKEAFADGIKAAVDAYWNWQTSRAGNRQGRRAGFPRFAKKGRDRNRVTFTTGAIRVEPDRRHVTLPRIGTVRVHENTRRLERLIAKDRARVLAATLSRRGTRLVVAFRVLIQRPIQPRAGDPQSRVGVDVGVRVLATVAGQHGEVIERAPNPRPLEAALKELRHLSRERSRRTRDSRRYTETQRKITRLQRRAASIRSHHLHNLTTRLAKTHGEIVVEGLDAAGMLRQRA